MTPEPVASDLVIESGVVTLAQGLRTKALGYKQKAETLEGLATVAEGLVSGSAAEKAFIEFVKTQGVDL